MSGEQVMPIPHKGSLCRIRLRSEHENSNTNANANANATATKFKTSTNQSFVYAITILNYSDHHGYSNINSNSNSRVRTRTRTRTRNLQLRFSPEQYNFLEHIFAILDTESAGIVNKDNFRDFVMLRCPVFKRRDSDFKQYHENKSKGKAKEMAANGRDSEFASESESAALGSAQRLDGYENYGSEFETPPDPGDYAYTHIDTDTVADTYIDQSYSTFDQVWDVVVSSAINYNPHQDQACTHLGIEGWMLFCRFISLAQYHDAKRRFSYRHLQTVQNKNEQGYEHEQEPSELIIVDLPPLLEPPAPLDIATLIQYDVSTQATQRVDGFDSSSSARDNNPTSILDSNTISEAIPLPELDLDHSYISIYDDSKKMGYVAGNDHVAGQKGPTLPLVQVSVFGSEHLHTNIHAAGVPSVAHTSVGSGVGNSDSLEFVIRYLPDGEGQDDNNIIIVRRSFGDLEWLDQTFKSHKLLGGTLCGRILPPFPPRLKSSSSDYGVGDHLYQKRKVANSTAVAVASAGVSAGVGMVSTAAKTAKSLWGNLPGSKHISKMVKTKVSSPTIKIHVQTLPKTKRTYSVKNIKNPNETPQSKARQIEKYLNYILEHPALSTSFPLNLILKASQSGLDAAKRILKDQYKNNNNMGFHRDGGVDDEKMSSLRASVFHYLPSANQTKNLEWVRSAAQAALVLKLHGLLETAGYQSTSTKLQHASLPQYAPNNADKRIECGTSDQNAEENIDCSHANDAISNVSDDECDGFDMLPDPLPFPERSALCAGSVYPTLPSDNISYSAYSNRDRYGTMQNTTLGDMEVERDIDRLRGLLRRVDKSFATCCNALTGINEHRKSRDSIHINIIRNIDNWNGMRGKILSQRSLLKGVTCLEHTSLHANKSYTNFAEDMMWTASLACAAYNASKDVCHAVQAAKVACRAKHTADIAVQKAIEAEMDSDGTLEESKLLHEKVSKSQMQALHAAVVDHEATAAKRRSVISLANDVKYWNTHRKRDMIKACKHIVEEQKLAAAENMKAWNELKQGLLASPTIFDIGQDSGHSPTASNISDIIIEEVEGQRDNIQKISLDRDIDVATSAQDYLSPQSIHYFEDDKSQPPDDASDPHVSRDEERHSTLSEDEEVEVEEDEAVLFSDALSSSALSHHSSQPTEQHDTGSGSEDYVNFGEPKEEEMDENNDMTDSMQSLVDGLLTWGGGGNWDDELGLALPKGMAASIAMEESSGMLDIA